MKGMSLLEHFSALEDPRQSWKVVYPLPEVLLLVLCATLGGAEDFVEVVPHHPLGALLAPGGEALHLHRHQPLGGETDHLPPPPASAA